MLKDQPAECSLKLCTLLTVLYVFHRDHARANIHAIMLLHADYAAVKYTVADSAMPVSRFLKQ